LKKEKTKKAINWEKRERQILSIKKEKNKHDTPAGGVLKYYLATLSSQSHPRRKVRGRLATGGWVQCTLHHGMTHLNDLPS
jgi:hypothetical protein